MSKGTKTYTFRLEDELVKEMEEAIHSRNAHSKEEPWTWSGFVRDAIRAKLDHRKRGSSQKRRKVFIDQELVEYAETGQKRGVET